jgi:hypothetical protein
MPEAGTWNRSIKGHALKLDVAAGGEDFELGVRADADGCLEEQPLKRITLGHQRQGTGISLNVSLVLFH